MASKEEKIMMHSGSKHYITETVLQLVRQSIQDNRGSKAAFCRITGITPYNLSKLLSGHKKFVYGDDWNRLCAYFPEIDDRNTKNKVSVVNVGSSITGVHNAGGDEKVETFRSELISAIIMLDIDPAAKDTVLKTITAFKRGEKCSSWSSSRRSS